MNLKYRKLKPTIGMLIEKFPRLSSPISVYFFFLSLNYFCLFGDLFVWSDIRFGVVSKVSKWKSIWKCAGNPRINMTKIRASITIKSKNIQWMDFVIFSIFGLSITIFFFWMQLTIANRSRIRYTHFTLYILSRKTFRIDCKRDGLRSECYEPLFIVNYALNGGIISRSRWRKKKVNESICVR